MATQDNDCLGVNQSIVINSVVHENICNLKSFLEVIAFMDLALIFIEVLTAYN